MSEREHHAAGSEARRTLPGRTWRPDEQQRQDMLMRYLGAVAATSAARAAERPQTFGEPEPQSAPLEHPRPEGPSAAQQPVREVMDVPAVSVPDTMPFLDIARTLSRLHLSSAPVVDADDHVLGVVSESDLLAKAAVEATEQHSGPIGRLREHRLYDKAQGETASTLMTAPAISVHPGTPVADAAWLAARSRLKRLPVTDHKGRLVGVVRRIALLQALIRDDAKIREEIESRIIEHEFRLDRGAVGVHVTNGVVDVEGRLDRSLIPQLLEEIGEIGDVVGVVDHVTAI
ncbi:CBS domain-containing protein [Streptomyces sp. RB6PN25]|uniref:CBS domain-containing protein n=1 Tax=Streptomyces humicola TaxID=2953240 RepID=A0ABT1PVM9_9ACTN|nr:CBS domain-containing protein [Streptomyces humicola]MCQ4080617.1 CBS domain-containing protein [Streptomyces humicola]